MDKRLRRFSRRSLVGVVVALAFAAAAGIGLAQVTSQPSTTEAALSTTGQSSSAGHENDFADTSSKENDDQETEQSDTSSGSAVVSVVGSQASTSGAETRGAGRQKVEVCHKTGNGKSHTIDVAAPAVPAHVAHGDTTGACATTPTTTAAAPPATSAPPSHGNSNHVTHHSSHGNSAHAHHGNSGGHGNGHGK